MKTPENKEKVIISDHFLKREVYKNVMTKIKEKNLKNIVIIGGSHSGYSCAWMLLNGPSCYHKHNFLGTVKWKQFP
jgi:hydroxymethylpyrimidine/phosphomethylpyrimidine kinase